jgi:NhaP-type Na+/H+ or K+/H+ antiporter
VYGLSWLVNRVSEPIALRWQHILNWGGLRGAISLALVLSLPISLGAERDLLRVMAFGVVLFTLLVQTTTMAPLIRWLKIITRSDAQVEYELHHARLTALRNADSHLDRLHTDGMLSSHTWERLICLLNDQAASLARKCGILPGRPVLRLKSLTRVGAATRSALHPVRLGAEMASSRMSLEQLSEMSMHS